MFKMFAAIFRGPIWRRRP